MPTAIELLEKKTEQLLDALEDLARQHIFTERADHPTHPRRSDSGAITANAEVLLLLAEHGRFKVTGEFGRMVLGYWPEHAPTPETDASKEEAHEG